MKNLWSIADLIDLHFFCKIDEEIQEKMGESALAKRDRIIYVAKIEPQLGKVDSIPPRLLVRKWMAIRRLQYVQERGHEGVILPGTVWRELAAICRVFVLLTGIFVGMSVAGTFLLYAGKTPLNVASYLGLFVLPQVLFLALQALLWLYRWWERVEMESTGLYVFFGRMLMRGLTGMRERLLRRLSGQQRLDFAALLGSVQQRKELAVLFIWPAFILVQLGGIGFNIGVFGTTLAKVVFSDVAFGWQSSLQLSAETVARLARWLALPWSWGMSHGYPTLAQIQGSHIVLKEGMAHLATDALVSWWPFLCAAVAVYGFLPRLALLVLGLVQQQRALGRLHFATLGIRPLLQRMTTARLDTNGVTVHDEGAVPHAVPAPDDNQEDVAAVAESCLPHDGVGPWFVFIPDELYDDCSLPTLQQLLGARINTACLEGVRYGDLGMEEEKCLAPITAAREAAGVSGVLLLQEAWQPPLRETESLLRKVRRRTGEAVPFTVLLIGKPSPQTIFTPVEPAHLQVWQQKMRAIGDPCLNVQPLIYP